MNKQLSFNFDTNKITEVTKENSLYNWCIQNNKTKLLEEWDYSLNSVTPKDIAYGSNKKMHWICLKDNKHKWVSTVGNRTGQINGCPYCSNKKVLVGSNDLATTNPEILKEWDYDKNSFLPTEITAGSNKKAWWKCSKGHSWQSTIVSRIMDGHGCAYCAGVRCWPGYNDLGTKNPELLTEWDYDKNKIKPNEIAPNSHNKVWWKCSKGHSWQASVSSRASLKCGCPVCAQPYMSSNSERIIEVYLAKYFTDIENNIHPDYLNKRELDIFIPSIKVAIEYDGGRFHKNVKRDLWKDNACIQNNIELIRIRDGACPDYESPIKMIHCEKSSGSYLELEKPMNELIDYLNTKFHLNIPKVDLKNDLQDLLALVAHKDYENSVANSSVIDEWDYDKNKISPESLSQGSCKIKVWWKCKTCGYEWQAAPGTRIGLGCGCPSCSHITNPAGRSVKDLYPEVAMEWNYDKNNSMPEDYFPQSNKKVWWKCKKCGYEWMTSICHRTVRKHDCPLCKGQVVVSGINDLKTKYPEVALDWNYDKNEKKPEEVSPGSNKKVFWKCHICGYEWQNIIACRTTRGYKCPNCTRSKIVNGTNNLLVNYPEAKELWDYETNEKRPEDYTNKSDIKVAWICPKGHHYKREIWLQAKGAKCPICSNHIILAGFNDLASKEPELLKEWDYSKNQILPTQVSTGTDTKAWWICEHGHSWYASIGQRVRTKSKCPICYHLSKIKSK